ncbi:MAG: hypothetical protein HY645_13530 [Acidobacteria bacterium]|nr:hypothetical protein [Acidobacteriota bacterium]
MVPLFVHEANERWHTLRELADSVLDDLARPVVRGSDLVVAEIRPLAIQFHRLHLRKLDGKMAAAKVEVLV